MLPGKGILHLVPLFSTAIGEIRFCPCLLGTIRLVFLESVMLWPVLNRSQPTPAFFSIPMRFELILLL